MSHASARPVREYETCAGTRRLCNQRGDAPVVVDAYCRDLCASRRHESDSIQQIQVTSRIGMGTAEELSAAIGATVAAHLRPEPANAVYGGCINRCYRWESSVGPLFVKLSSAEGRDMLAAEADGLEALRQADAVRVPRVLGLGSNESDAWIVLEWVSFGHPSADSDASLGE